MAIAFEGTAWFPVTVSTTKKGVKAGEPSFDFRIFSFPLLTPLHFFYSPSLTPIFKCFGGSRCISSRNLSCAWSWGSRIRSPRSRVPSRSLRWSWSSCQCGNLRQDEWRERAASTPPAGERSSCQGGSSSLLSRELGWVSRQEAGSSPDRLPLAHVKGSSQALCTAGSQALPVPFIVVLGGRGARAGAGTTPWGVPMFLGSAQVWYH